MDRKSVIGLILIALILGIFTYLNTPSVEEERARQAARDSIALAQQKAKPIEVEAEPASNDTTLVQASGAYTDSTVATVSNDSLRTAQETARLQSRYGAFAAAAIGEDSLYVLENEKLKVYFRSKGGHIAYVELKEYQTYKDFVNKGEKVPLRLFDEDSSSLALSFFFEDQRLQTSDFYFSTIAPTIQSVEKSDSVTLVFRLASSNVVATGTKQYIDFIYTLHGDSYILDFKVDVKGFPQEVVQSIELNWQMKMLSTEKLIDNERMVSSVFYKYNGEGRSYLSETSSDKLQLETVTNWVAFKQSYFSAIIFSPEGIRNQGSEIAINTLNSGRYIKGYEANLNLSSNSGNTVVPLRFYFGPNDYHELKKMGHDMENIVNLGWGIFGWVNKYLVIPVFNFLESFGLNYGIIILLLTIIVKLLIMPLTYRNYKSSAKMRVLKPEVEEIGKRYGKEDAMKKQQEVMALYRRSGVNPMAGCIPLLIQMPVLIAVFRFFPAAIELRQESFLWAEDLSAYDSILQLGFHIPFYGDHVSLFTLLMCVSTILITRMNSGQMDTSMPGMKVMMYVFPIMMLFFFNNFSSGLTYYYFIGNILSLIIMWAIKKWFIDEKKLLATIHENRKKPQSPKKSAFMQRLEEAARQRQQQQQGKKRK